MASCALRHAHSDAIHSDSHALTQFPAAFAFIRRNRRSTAWKKKSSMDDFQDPPRDGFFIHYFATPPASAIPSPAAGFFCRHSKYSPEKWIRPPRKQFHSRFKKDRLRISGFISHGNGGSGGNPEVPPDFRRCSPPAKS